MHIPQHMAVKQPIHVPSHKFTVGINQAVRFFEGLKPISVVASEEELFVLKLCAEPAIVLGVLVQMSIRQVKYSSGHVVTSLQETIRSHGQASCEIRTVLRPNLCNNVD